MKTPLENVVTFLENDCKLGFISEDSVNRIRWYIETYFMPKEKELLKKSAPEFLTKIDWKLLREQKIMLLKCQKYRHFNYKDEEYLQGIINLIDSIQDYAIDEMGISDKEIFNITSEEE
jgi:hypothetical protein